MGAIVCCSDSELADEAKAYVRSIATHIALLFVLRKARSQQELGIAGCWSATLPRSLPQARFGVLNLNMLVAVRAFATALVQESPAETAAACHSLEILVDAILTLAEARPPGCAAEEAATKMDVDEKYDLKQSGAGPAAGGNGRAEDSGRDDGPRAMGPPPAQKPRAGPDTASKLRFQTPLTPPSLQASLPAVLDDLVAFVLRTCYGDTWAARIGGAAGLGVLIKRLPGPYIKPWAPQLCGAFSRVLTALPEHATKEITSLQGILQDLAVKSVRSIVPAGYRCHRDVMDSDAPLPALNVLVWPRLLALGLHSFCACLRSSTCPGAAAVLVRSNTWFLNPRVLSVQNDYDVIGLIDQIVIALFSQKSSPTLRHAAVGILSELDARFGLTPEQVIGDRLLEPHIAFPNLSLFYKSSAQAVRTALYPSA